MNEPRAIPLRPRDRLFAAVTVVLAVLLLPVAFARHPGRARELACSWALRMRFPAGDPDIGDPPPRQPHPASYGSVEAGVSV